MSSLVFRRGASGRLVSAARCARPPRWLGDSPSGHGDTSLRASTSTARTGNLHLPDHLLSAVSSTLAARSRRHRVNAYGTSTTTIPSSTRTGNVAPGRTRAGVSGTPAAEVELRAVPRADDHAALLVPARLRRAGRRRASSGPRGRRARRRSCRRRSRAGPPRRSSSSPAAAPRVERRPAQAKVSGKVEALPLVRQRASPSRGAARP